MKRLPRLALATLCLSIMPSQAATPLDTAQLTALIKRTPALVIVDARGDEARKRRPIPFAVAYRPGLTLKASVVAVIGEQDGQAMEAARRLEIRPGLSVFTARGGYDTWLAANDGQGGRDSITPQNFTIPHNTCEQGRVLQEYK